jgi:hypothetical protein
MDDHSDPAGTPAGTGPGTPDGDPPAPPPVPRPVTGEPRVDAALTRLDELTELPVTEHPALFERVAAQLGEVLGELGSMPPPARDGR